MNDDLILTDDDMKSMAEIYLSGFVSGGVSLAVSSGISEMDAISMVKQMTSALQADPDAWGKVSAVIQACLTGEDGPPDSLTVVQGE
jgi:hypothetical protein